MIPSLCDRITLHLHVNVSSINVHSSSTLLIQLPGDKMEVKWNLLRCGRIRGTSMFISKIFAETGVPVGEKVYTMYFVFSWQAPHQKVRDTESNYNSDKVIIVVLLCYNVQKVPQNTNELSTNVATSHLVLFTFMSEYIFLSSNYAV